MSPLEAAKRLVEADPWSEHALTGQWFCAACGPGLYDAHQTDCPWLALPLVVEVLEIAQRIAERHSGGAYGEDLEDDIRALSDVFKGKARA